ncbi:hypothetical protein ACLKA6_005734 [Drosophila palustris]
MAKRTGLQISAAGTTETAQLVMFVPTSVVSVLQFEALSFRKIRSDSRNTTAHFEARVRSSRLSSSMTSHAIFSTASQFSLDAIMFCTKLLGVGSTPKVAATVLLCLLNLGQSKMTCSASSRCSVPQVLQ